MAKAGNSVTISHEDESLASPKKANAAAADDDVDDYYANLAASQAAYNVNNAMASTSTSYASANPRKEDDAASSTQHGSPGSNGKLVDSGYEEFGEEVDLGGGQNGSYSYSPTPGSPSATLDTSNHLNTSQGSLADHSRSQSRNGDLLRPASAASMTNSLGKRSREPSEESEGGKKIRTAQGTPLASGATTPALAPNGSYQNGLIHDAAQQNEEEEEEVEDPILTVAGKEMRFSAITEEMTSDMTPEEYTLWWEIMSTME